MVFFFFFLKFLADTCPFFGPLVPLFWISGDVSSGFQSQSRFCLIRYFCGGECNVHSPRFTSGATLADLLAAGAQPVTSPHACAEVGLGSDSNVQPHEQKTNALPLCQRPGFLCDGLILLPHFTYRFIFCILCFVQASSMAGRKILYSVDPTDWRVAVLCTSTTSTAVRTDIHRV